MSVADMIEKGSKIAITVCSNGQQEFYKEKINHLLTQIRQIGFEPVCSDFLYERDSYFSGTGEERARALIDFYENPEIAAIFDISGGDIAYEVLGNRMLMAGDLIDAVQQTLRQTTEPKSRTQSFR